MAQIQIWTDWTELKALGEQWNSLVAQSADPSIFLTWEWLDSWWQSYAGASKALVLMATDTDKIPVLIAPLQPIVRRVVPGVSLRILRFVGDGTYDSDNLNLIAKKDRAAEGVSALLHFLETRAKDWDVLELNTLVAESPVVTCLKDEIARRGWVQNLCFGPRTMISLPETWDAYWAKIPQKMRAELQRRRRKLECDHDAKFWRCENPDELPSALEHLFRLNTLAWRHRGQAGSFAQPGRCEFYRRMAPRMLERGWLDFWLLDADGRTIAAEFGLCYGDTRTALIGGFDPEFASLSPRNVLKAHVIREAIARGIRYYDFLGGGESHKLRWGGEQQNYVFLSCAAPGTRGALYLNVTETAARGKEWARNKIPVSVWEFLRKTYRRLRPLE